MIPSTTSAISPIRPRGCRAAMLWYETASAGSFTDVLMTPRETALTRTPRDAYSMASERATATSAPLVREASADGTVLLAWSTRLVLMLTTWPLPWATIWQMARWVIWKNPVRFTAGHAAEASR